eukprot:6255442-Prymnesium_polylepis.1
MHAESCVQRAAPLRAELDGSFHGSFAHQSRARNARGHQARPDREDDAVAHAGDHRRGGKQGRAEARVPRRAHDESYQQRDREQAR